MNTGRYDEYLIGCEDLSHNRLQLHGAEAGPQNAGIKVNR